MGRRTTVPDDEWRYGERSSAEFRSTLLELMREFVVSACGCRGVTYIALVGSILTTKPRPKDIDVLVRVTGSLDMPRLTRLARRLKGSAQARLNSGADVFVADSAGQYIGRVCHYRECHDYCACGLTAALL